jgi:hypothetical protein
MAQPTKTGNRMSDIAKFLNHDFSDFNDLRLYDDKGRLIYFETSNLDGYTRYEYIDNKIISTSDTGHKSIEYLDDKGRTIRSEYDDWWIETYYNDNNDISYTICSTGVYSIHKYNDKGNFLEIVRFDIKDKLSNK